MRVLSLLILPLAVLVACADTELPDLTVPAGEDTRFGIDTRKTGYTFGLHITDPFKQRSP